MIRAGWARWLQAPSLSGRSALLCAALALGLPTLIRFAAIGAVTGCEFTPYLPFVLICAILVRWWQAAAVAAGAVLIMGGLFQGSPAVDLQCFVPAAGIFLASSAVLILFAVAVRRLISAIHNRGADESEGGIVFSLEKGEVWASWYGQGPPVRLGSQRKVSEMMQDFLAQVEVGKRLNRR